MPIVYKSMKVLPNLKAVCDGCISEREILKAMPEELIPVWEKYMRGKTVQEIGFDDWGVPESDYESFRRHIINHCLKHMSEEEKA